jgi:hypothetical protein
MDYCDSHSSNLGFLGGPSFVEEVVVSSRTLSDEYIVSEIVLSGHRIYNGIEGTSRTDWMVLQSQSQTRRHPQRWDFLAIRVGFVASHLPYRLGRLTFHFHKRWIGLWYVEMKTVESR